ncbi:Phthiocerol/phenolphthiocerol synthesis polyketide synthase type I PpsE [Nymphon striatum]|nr:Phthiocerol/phenolphthiocerol synthesis polyketide synthase type I PpsE [Nymphon striatum]
MEGLHMAFGEQEENNFCAIGSVKSNMGHLTAAAGVTGFIKTVLAMQHQKIPASLGYNTPNPAIDFDNSPFFVNAELRNWDVDEVRRAGVSSFGVGGTNVHVILEEFLMEEKTSDAGRPMQLLPWSAKSETSLANYGSELGNYLDNNAELNLADRILRAEQRSQLIDIENNRANKNVLKVVPSEIAFLFPGQGAQYVQMGKALYENEPVFTEAVDHCAELLMDTLQQDIRELIFPKVNNAEAENRLKDTRFTQPALFVIEYALAQLWMSWGIQPTLYCDALHLIATRGRLVSELPGGSMLSVRLSADKVLALLPDTLSIGAMNSDRLCTWLTEAEAQNPEYWTDHLRATVRFTDAMDTILGLEDVVVLEVGPGRVLATLARQKKEAKSLTTISSLPFRRMMKAHILHY